jgi:hypothetical protein
MHKLSQIRLARFGGVSSNGYCWQIPVWVDCYSWAELGEMRHPGEANPTVPDARAACSEGSLVIMGLGPCRPVR